MPASKKDLKKQQQKQNMKDGIGDAKGRIPSRTKVKGDHHQISHTIWSVLGGEVEKVGPNPSLVLKRSIISTINLFLR